MCSRGELQLNLPVSKLGVCSQSPFRKVYLCRVWREPGEIITATEHGGFIKARVVGFVSVIGRVTPQVLLLKKDKWLKGAF